MITCKILKRIKIMLNVELSAVFDVEYSLNKSSEYIHGE